MSDVGLLPPGSGVWFVSLGWCAVCVLGFFICLLAAWWRVRREGRPWLRDPFFGAAMGALVSGVAAGCSMWLIDWSGSLGALAHALDRGPVALLWLSAQAALWPIVAWFWNRA